MNTVTILNTLNARKEQTQEIPYSELSGIIKASLALPPRDKMQLPMIKLGRFGSKTKREGGTIRNAANLQSVSGVEIDYDDGKFSIEEAHEILKIKNINHLIHHSPSHTPEFHKWRLFVPFAEEICSTERGLTDYRTTAIRHVVKHIGEQHFDGCSYTLAQCFYYGVGTGGSPESCLDFTEGAYIDNMHDLNETLEKPQSYKAGRVDGKKVVPINPIKPLIQNPKSEHDLIRSALEFIPADSYENCRDVGMSLSTSTKIDGFAMWDSWLGTNSYWATEGIETPASQWGRFDASGGRQMGSLFSDATRNGWTRGRIDTAVVTNKLKAVNGKPSKLNKLDRAVLEIESMVGEQFSAFKVTNFTGLNQGIVKKMLSQFWAKPDGKIQYYSTCETTIGVRDLKKTLTHITGGNGQLQSAATLWGSIQDQSNEDRKAFNKFYSNGVVEAVCLWLQINRACDQLDISTDMFSKTQSHRSDGSLMRISVAHRPIRVKNPVPLIDDAITSDFLEHCPWWLELMDFIVMARFASTRKRCYLHVNCASDFGKSLIMAPLTDTQRCVETSTTELGLAIDGKPSGLTPGSFLNSLCLVLDEETKVTGQIKSLGNAISFNAKFKSQCSIPVYSKIFLSRVDIPSLASTASGVEEQFANRFTKLVGKGALTDRPLHKQDSTKYNRTIIHAGVNYLNKKIAEMIELGRSEAESVAGKFIDQWHSDHALSNFYGTFKESITMHTADFLSDVVQAVAETDHNGRPIKQTPFEEFAIKNRVNVTVMDKHGNPITKLYIKRPSKLFSLWLHEISERSDLYTMNVAKQDVMLSLSVGNRGVVPHGIPVPKSGSSAQQGQKTIKAILVKDDLLKEAKESV